MGANLIAVGLNAAPLHVSRTVTGVLGITTGVVGMVIGFPPFGAEGNTGFKWGPTPPPGVQRTTLGYWNAGVGAVSAAFGVYRLTAKRSGAAPVNFAPWLSANGAPGISGRVSF